MAFLASASHSKKQTVENQNKTNNSKHHACMERCSNYLYSVSLHLLFIYLFWKFSWNDFPRQYFHVAPSTFLINWLVLSEPACYVYKAINWLCQICVSVLDIITIISRALFNYFFKIKIALATRATSTSLSSQAAVGHCHRQQQSDSIVVMAGTSTEWRHSLGAVRWSQGPRPPAWLQLTRPSSMPRGTSHPGR